MTGDLVSGDQGLSTENDRIAKAALAEVPNEGAILLDASSTISRLAAALPADRELTVVTNSIPLAQSLCEQPNFTVMLLGGRIRRRSLSVVDSWVLHTLADTYVDVAFIATDGVSTDRGLTVADAAAAMVKRAAVAAARRTVLLADHTKIGKNHLAKFADLGDVDTFITDTGIDPLQVPEIVSSGSRLVTA
jgi:DeoR family fructose operon transcriptional repressor